jgi:two-component system cell cycle sensor histidine kinase/response regulator CckA
MAPARPAEAVKRGLLRPLLPDRALVSALLADAAAAVALLDRRGRVVRAGGAFTALAGPVLAFAEPAASRMQAALRDGVALCCSGDMVAGPLRVPVAIAVTPTGLGSPVAVLRLTDLRPERALQAQLAQAQRLQAVGVLAGGIAHDFNNLLTAIAGAAEDLVGQTEAAGQADLAQIRESAARGAALVRQLLAFGGQQTLRPCAVALNDAVRAAARLLERLLGRGIALKLELEEPGRTVLIDATQLDQVLVNLAVNARDAMPAGGTLTIATARRLLLAPLEEGGQVIPPGRYASIEVRDTGSGIQADVLPHIFEPFFSTRRGSGGTGLGLSTVHGIVRQSGGYLTVESSPGAGTVFRITLPRHEAAAAAAVVPVVVPVEPPLGEGRRVLLVDDEAAVRRLAARALRRAGWEVREAEDGQAALAADCATIDLVISDVVMPGLDGPGLVHALRERRPGLPALLMSGYAEPGQRAALLRDDIVFLAKPFGMAQLVAAAGEIPLARFQNKP